MRVLSGIQPTGEKHLGNYAGAIRRWVAQQHEVDAFHPIVNLHAITVPQEPDELREATLDLAALLIACGLDPDVCTLFVQSHVPEHPRLSWVLECMTPYGELRRMPQFREKSAAQTSFSVGLMTYPVLQAADILLYDADVVPVGEDQRQHLELARDVAQRFNQRFGETFVVPEGTYGELGAKIMDLQEPESRMSTSLSSDLGLVKVLDPPDTIRRKVRSAVTDSGREVVRAEDKPGVTNLIEIMAVATGASPEAIEARYNGAGYGRFKEEVAEAVVELLDPIRLRYGELRGDPAELAAILAQGAEKAHTIAAATLERVHERVGFVPPEPPVYVAPDGSYSATYPGIRRRLGAGAIDWVLCWVVFLIASIVGGIVQGVGVTSLDAGDLGGIPGVALIVVSQLIVAASIVAYFAFYWAQGSTLGMRALDFELVLDVTGRPPGWRRTVPRAIVAWLVALAILNVYLASSGRPEDDPFNTFERALIVASVAVASVGVAAKAWMLVDSRRRSVFDRLFGLLYLDEIVFTNARRSPWAEGGVRK